MSKRIMLHHGSADLLKCVIQRLATLAVRERRLLAVALRHHASDVQKLIYIVTATFLVPLATIRMLRD